MDKLEKKEAKESKEEKEELMHGFKDNKSSLFSAKLLGVLLVIAFLGIGSGYLLAGNSSGGDPTSPGKRLLGSGVEKGKTYGEGDLEEYKDTAEGELKEGGVEGEGQYHLVRPGGDSQNVYLTSSHVDLSLFIDHKVKVWGATQTAQVAGWLMDVGRVQVLE